MKYPDQPWIEDSNYFKTPPFVEEPTRWTCDCGQENCMFWPRRCTRCGTPRGARII